MRRVEVFRRIGLLEAFLVFVAVLFVTDAAIGYRAFIAAGEQASRAALEQAADTVVSEIDDLEFDTEALLLRLTDWSDPGRPDFLEPHGANAFLMWYMRTHPHVTSVNYGDSLGNAYMIMFSEGRWTSRLKRAADSGVVTWAELDERGMPLAREERPDDYDPMTCPWYAVARDASGIQWSPPYVFRTSHDPGITASARIDGGGSEGIQVVGVDVRLSDISRLLAGLNRETPGLDISIVSDDGRVLASSEEEIFLPYLERESAELPTLSEVGLRDVRAAVRALSPRGGTVVTPVTPEATEPIGGAGFLEFESSGARLYGLAEPVNLSGDLGLSVVMTIPRETFVSYFESAGRLKISLFLLFVLVASVFFVMRYVIPLRRLTSSVSTLGTEAYVRLPSSGRRDEVGVLESEFGRLADDLAARRRELFKSEARYRELFESVQDGVFETGADGRFVRANRGMAEIFGVSSAGDLVGRVAQDFWSDPAERTAYLDELASHKSVGSYRCQSRRHDGTPIIVDVSAVRLEGPEGEFLGTEGIMREVTSSVEAAETLRRAADEWRSTFDSMPDLVSVHDRDYRVVKANAAMGAFFGMEPDDLVGMSCHELYHGSDHACEDCPFPEMARTLRTISSEIDDPHLGVPLLVTVSPILGDEGRFEGCVHVARDLSERRRLEEQLRQSQKMEAVGRLAGGVAHDFNNMLSVIVGFTEEALDKIGPTDPATKDLLEVRSAAERSANLTRQLLAFSRRQPVEPSVIELNVRLQSMEGMLSRLLGEDIHLRYELFPGLWAVRADPSQMDQAVANLAANARDAMPEGGTLLVETGNVTFGDLEVAGEGGIPAGDYAMVAVSDDGEGMDPETLRHAFEPFFTTKEEGRGTGLGLATVYGIVKQNAGWVDVESSVGEGTTVRIYLPRHRGEAGPQPVKEAVETTRACGETVLLVEDEQQVRRLVRVVLDRLGYHVLEAAGPEEALALCEEHRGTIHLLLTDVVMPVLNGRELHEQAQVRLPGIRVLFMSGYAADVIAGRGALNGAADLLEKPFSPEELGRKVREVLDRP
ncbi:MAG: PAS domain-containing protein [Thermoleophilia bacterium]